MIKSEIELDIELTASCNKLRILIHGEQQAELNAAKWRAMANESTQKKEAQRCLGSTRRYGK